MSQRLSLYSNGEGDTAWNIGSSPVCQVDLSSSTGRIRISRIRLSVGDGNFESGVQQGGYKVVQ